MNFALAVEEFEGDENFLKEVLDGFLANVNNQLKIIDQALNIDDAEQVRREAHSIKGGAANLTADVLAQVAFELEDIGRSGDLTNGHNTLNRLNVELCRLEEFYMTMEQQA